MDRRWKALVVVFGLVGGGCVLPVDIDVDAGPDVRGSGHLVVVQRNLPAFDAISVRGPVRVEIARTGRERLELEAEDNLLDWLEMEVRGGVLHIGVVPGVSLAPRREIVYHVESWEVVELDASAASSVELDVGRVARLWISVSGASRVAAWGVADEQDLNVSGASRFDAFDLDSWEVRADVSGASLVDVRVSDLLDVVASGASRVRYIGWPEVFADVSGASAVIHY